MKKRLALLLIPLLLLVSGCGEDEYWAEDYGDENYDEYADEYEEYADDYDEEYDGYEGETDDYEHDGEEAGLLEGIFSNWLYDTPEDCYEDEYFDEESQLCLLFEGEYGEYDEPTLLEDFLGFVFGYIPDGNFEPASGSAEEVEVTYDIQGDQITLDTSSQLSSESMEQHQQIWAYFTRLVPADARSMVVQFGVSSDGPEETMAWVEPLVETDLSAWILVIDPADASPPQELTFTLIHEYGHLLTLNQEQVNTAGAACSTYEPQEGCSDSNSYLNAFYEQFWTDLLPQILEIEQESDDDRYYDLLDEFYQAHSDQFISDYAATNLEEDIAESWAHFVLDQKPDGDTIAEQKVLFFYDYPELVELRRQIIQRINTQLRKSQ